jgi:hypothetical protein
MLVIYDDYWDELYIYYYTGVDELSVELIRTPYNNTDTYSYGPYTSPAKLEDLRRIFFSRIIHDSIEEDTILV